MQKHLIHSAHSLPWSEQTLSQEKILETLQEIGLTKVEAKIYILIEKKGPLKARDIVKRLKITKQQLYPILKKLKGKGIITSSLEHPARFFAIEFEKVLDLFSKAKIEEAKNLQINKERLFNDWESISVKQVSKSPPTFTVIQGRKYIYSKIQQMIQEANNKFSLILSLSELIRIEQSGVLDSIETHPLKSTIQFRIITEIPEKQQQIVKKLLKNFNPKIQVKSQIGFTSSLFPKMAIKDNEEILYFISTEKIDAYDSLVTNCKSIIKPLFATFEDLWEKSTSVSRSITDIEKKNVPQTTIIEDWELASEKCSRAMNQANENIIIVTSSEEVTFYWKNPSLLKELANKGVSIKIMAPISRTNLNACIDLLSFCEIRHVPNEYIKTIIVDKNHLFQFKIPNSNKKTNNAQNNNQTLYSSDVEYIDKTNKMLLDIWKNSARPSSTAMIATLENLALSKPPAKKKAKYKFLHKAYTTQELNDKTNKTKIKEQDVINKILNYKKNPVTTANNTMCGFAGHALIHPQETLNSPDLYIAAYHMDEESSYGAEDALIIMSWLNTPKGFKYVPLAIAGNNPKASESWKRIFKDPFAPASKNYNLFQREEIQIQLHGKTFFVGWTKAIPILPNQSLPPSAIILEATGTIRSYDNETTFPNGVKFSTQQNCYDAFVTMVNKKIKYQGPATDGIVVRDLYQDGLLP